MFVYFILFQTITGAMSTLNPPVALEKKENEPRVEYIQDYASSKNINNTLILYLFSKRHFNNFCDSINLICL